MSCTYQGPTLQHLRPPLFFSSAIAINQQLCVTGACGSRRLCAAKAWHGSSKWHLSGLASTTSSCCLWVGLHPDIYSPFPYIAEKGVCSIRMVYRENMVIGTQFRPRLTCRVLLPLLLCNVSPCAILGYLGLSMMSRVNGLGSTVLPSRGRYRCLKPILVEDLDLEVLRNLWRAPTLQLPSQYPIENCTI